MRSLIFAKRNFKEIVRDPLSLFFYFAFPVILMLIFQIIIGGIGVTDFDAVPQFKIENLTMSIAVFSFSFLTLFSLVISKDRETSFQARLRSSPMRPADFLIGYSLPLLPIAFAQIVIVVALGFIFGLTVSWNLLLAILGLIPAILLFLGLGMLIGAGLKGGAASGVSSLVINIAVLLSGMFFPLANMTGAFVTVMNILPFAPALKIPSSLLAGNYADIWIPLATVMAYVVVIFALAIWVFYRKMKSDAR